MNDLFRNGEQYFDPTAGAAISNIERGEVMEYKAGDIVRLTRATGTPREFAVLAADSDTIVGIGLHDTEYPGDIEVLCYTPMYASPMRLEFANLRFATASFLKAMTEHELFALRDAVADILSIEHADIAEDVPDEVIDAAEEQAKELIEARATARVYKELYENLLSQMIRG